MWVWSWSGGWDQAGVARSATTQKQVIVASVDHALRVQCIRIHPIACSLSATCRSIARARHAIKLDSMLSQLALGVFKALSDFSQNRPESPLPPPWVDPARSFESNLTAS